MNEISPFVAAPQPTLKRRADLSGPDYFPTPKWATRALLEAEKFDGNIWECACGDGAMSVPMQQAGYEVASSDLFDRGFGEAGHDFLTTDRTADNIVTNPPFHSAEAFVHVGLKASRNKFALLLRLAFLESSNREKTIFTVCPPARVLVFSERITFYQKDAVQAGSGTTAYAWFVWDKTFSEGTELRWVPSGSKARLNY